MKQFPSADVQFVLLGLPTSVGAITGIALCYDTEDKAKNFFDFVHKYLSTPGQRQRYFRVEFTRPPTGKDSVDLDIMIVLDEELRHVKIEGIAADDLDKLQKSLGEYKAYFILAGYKDAAGTFTPIEPYHYHMFKADIYVNGTQMMGKKGGKWPEVNPFTGH